MTTYSDLFPDDVVMLTSVVFREEAESFSYYVPNDSTIGKRIKYAVITAEACGGMGANPGGGGSIVKRKAVMTPGEMLLIQVGKASTASVLGDSFVKRADNTVLAYADRGRGNGNAGLASNSTGDLKRDGYPAAAASPNQGAPASDSSIAKSQGYGGFGYNYAQPTLSQAADPGGAGILVPMYDVSGNFTGGYTTEGAGTGSVTIEFYSGDPGPIDL